MTRLVVVNHYPLLPVRNGGQQAVAGLAAALADRWPTELVWTERKTACSSQVELGGRELTATAVPNRWLQRKAARYLRNGLGVIDGDIGSMLFSGGNRQLVNYLESALADGDVLLLSHPWLWPAVERVLAHRRVLLVYDAHNIEHVLKRESLRPSSTGRWAVQRVTALERDVVRRADLVLTCTRGDAQTLAELAGVSAERFVIGSKGVETSAQADAIAAIKAQQPPGRRALFVGSKHPPNNDAARWIINVLAPQLPEWQFVIAGASGPASGAAVRSGNVEVLGHVDDLLAEIGRADVALNPITAGSGINMKLFSYLQCGVPALSTAFGARGFEGIEHTGLVQLEPEHFAQGLVALQAEPARYRQLSTDGAACVRRHFTWDAIGASVGAAIQARLRGGAPGTTP